MVGHILVCPYIFYGAHIAESVKGYVMRVAPPLVEFGAV